VDKKPEERILQPAGENHRGQLPRMRDVLLVLSENYAILGWLEERLMAASTPGHRRHLFYEFARALGGHLRGIDHAIVPALRHGGWQDVSSEVLVGHADTKHRLAELLTLTTSGDPFERALLAFIPVLERQRKREQLQLVPVLKRLLDGPARASLGTQVQGHFKDMYGDAAPRANASEAADLLEEARIVLGTFPGR